MTGTNHALTGAYIAGAIGNPLIFVPVAFVSHFVLDSLPHFGEAFGKRKKLSKAVWVVDFTLLLIGLAILLVTSNWLLILGALAAISPDLAWIFRFAIAEKWGTLSPTKTNRFNTWHASIQKYERRWGLGVEIAWLATFIVLHLSYTL